ncbi:protein kinase [Nocardia sp. CA2R105]|uniref:protein kinase n=1 Tax=Nocardia coffeae TaxID=2873381 RepID=UPI001CA7085F|nr:protein kinase [Nocardia coffeae]MBY8858244.1 protein kinase [Nocardia coffeae]
MKTSEDSGTDATWFAPWRVGDVVAGLYEVREVITSGGMGLVYRVWHRGWRMELAVKAPRPDLVDSPTHLRDFESEAEAWVGLGVHPNTVSCVYVRRLDDGVPRVFAEWADGGSLADVIGNRTLYQGNEQQVLGRLLDVAIQFAWGLEHAHANGLIHQDVKPANVLLTADGVVKVTDFGLAKARKVAGESAGARQGASVLAGFGGLTPAYCSPEQALAVHDASVHLSRATDVWSWAITVWELFTADRPCDYGQVAAEAFESFVADARRTEIPTLPRQLAGLLRRCFAGDPSARPRMHSLADELTDLYTTVTGSRYPRMRPDAAELLADGLSNQALSLLDLGDTERAEHLWDRALSADPHHPHAVYNYGLYRWRTGRITDTQLIAGLESVRETHPGDPLGEHLAGLAHLERGDTDAARRHLGRAARQSPGDPEVAAALRLARGLPEEPEPVVIRDDARIHKVAVSADGRIALTGGDDGCARVWDLTTGVCTQTLNPDRSGSSGIVDAVAISADGTHAMVSKRNFLMAWDLRHGQYLFGAYGWAQSLALSADGMIAVSGGDTRARVEVWDLLRGRKIHVLVERRRRSAGFRSVGVTADGRLAVASDDLTRQVRVWDVATGRLARVLDGFIDVQLNAESGLAVSRLADNGSPGREPVSKLVVWRVDTGQVVHTAEVLFDWFHLTGHRVVTADGRTAVTGDDYHGENAVRIWELDSGRCLRTLHGHTSPMSVTLSGDGRILVSGSRDRSIRVWRPAASGPKAQWSFARPRAAGELAAHAAIVEAAVVEFDRLTDGARWREAANHLRRARTIPGYERSPMLLDRWRHAGGSRRRTELLGAWERPGISAGDDTAGEIAISPDDRLVLTAGRGQPRIWDLATGRLLHTLDGHDSDIANIAFSRDGTRVVSSGCNGTVCVWDPHTGRRMQTVLGRDDAIWAGVTVTPDGNRAFCPSQDGTVRLWNLTTGQCTQALDARDIVPVDLYARSKLPVIFQLRIVCDRGDLALVANSSHALGFWDLTSGTCLKTIDIQPRKPANSMGITTIAGDDHRAFSALDDCVIHEWSMKECRLERMLEGHSKHVTNLVTTEDGRLLLSGSADSTVRVWDRTTGQCTHTLAGHTDSVSALAVSADARFAVSAGHDHTLRIWDLISGRCARTLETGSRRIVSTLALTTDGHLVVSAAWDSARVWELDWDYEFPTDDQQGA